MRYSVVLPCAGSGSRMQLGYNKLLWKMKNGRTILENTVSIFLRDERCFEVVLVVDKTECSTWEKMFCNPKIKFVIGGKTRQESVYAGLQVVTEKRVLIHDGARPFLDQATLDRLLIAAETYAACLVAVPCKDTIKVVEKKTVKKTPPREVLYQAQTPQAFDLTVILSAYQKAEEAGFMATDDASVVEAFSDVLVHVVPGDYQNIKVTTPEDFVYDR